MNRLQKKCMIASTGIHLLLAVMLLVGPAFLSSGRKSQSLQILDFIPANAIEGDASGGGGPRMRPPGPITPIEQPPAEQPTPPPPQPQQAVTPPAPQPRPQPVRAPEPEPPKITQVSPEAIEPPKPQKHKIVPSTDIVTGSTKDSDKAKADKLAADKAAARKAAEAQKRLATAFGRVTRDLKSGFSGGTDVKFNDGFGGSGPAYASWIQIVNSIYQNDWKSRVPPGAADDSASGVAKVTIARDGTVISSRITDSSGNSTVDRYIQATLDRVKFTKAFPETSKEETTEIEIEFKVISTKPSMG